jgi:hypothetical protein
MVEAEEEKIMRGTISYMNDAPYDPLNVTDPDPATPKEEKIRTKIYAGSNRRSSDRYQLSKENQEMVNVLTKKMQCMKDHCIVPKEAQPHVSHHYGALKEIGEGDIGKGIDKTRNQFFEVEGVSGFWKDVKRKAILSIIYLVIAFVAGILLLGFIEKMKTGM